jgi:hypothetical protein
MSTDNHLDLFIQDIKLGLKLMILLISKLIDQIKKKLFKVKTCQKHKLIKFKDFKINYQN